MKVSTRRGALAAIFAGLAYVIESIMGVIKPQSEFFSGISDYVLEAVFIIALAGTIFAVMGLHAFAQGRYGKAGMIGFWLTLIGTALIMISAMLTFFVGQNSLGAAFLGGVLLDFIGYVVLGITTLRSKILPLWVGLSLIFGFPVSVILSSFGGGVLFGLAWLMLGYFLWSQRSIDAPQEYAGKSI